jgi:apolipoprotein N-acyltransferase
MNSEVLNPKPEAQERGAASDSDLTFRVFRISPPPAALRFWPAILLVAGTVACFEIAYTPVKFGPARCLIVGYLICLTQLARLKTTRLAFYTGLTTGLLCVAPQLDCFWRIFGPAAIPLWLVMAFWVGLYVSLAHAVLVRFGPARAAVVIPFIWTGLEYFRSELYFLRFSWLNIGYAFADSPASGPLRFFGVYGLGFLAAVIAAAWLTRRILPATLSTLAVVLTVVISLRSSTPLPSQTTLRIAGVQFEFPMEQHLPRWLDRTLAEHPDSDILVLSEYTLEGSVPESLCAWCRQKHRYLVVGGKDPGPNGNFYNTAFVIGPTGEIVFRQAKTMPLQFFKDGLPAPAQAVWNSPWGKIGICICYDLSYTRVTDRLVKLGAQMLIVPTMDVVEWGRREHELHALIAPVRAAEYGVPVFRLGSSGISQAVNADGRVMAMAPFPGEGARLAAAFRLPLRGSVPLDRIWAPVAVAVTAVSALVLAVYRRPAGEALTKSEDRNPNEIRNPKSES